MTPDALARCLADADGGRLAQALATVDPASAAGKALRGEVARRRGDHASATTLLDEAADAFPALAALQHAAALAHVARGDRGAARRRWLALHGRAPDDPAVRYQIALTYDDDGEPANAAQWYEAQLARTPGMPGAWLNLGRARAALGDAERAMHAWDRAHALRPDDVRPLRWSAALADERADLAEAVDRYTQAIDVAPGDAALRYARAASLSSLAQHADAVADLQAALSIEPQNGAGRSALLLELHYDESLAGIAQVRAAHDEWNARHAQLPRVLHPARPRAPRLRIGYLSPRFGDAPLAALLLPVLQAHDRDRLEIVAYAARPANEHATKPVRDAVDRWRELPAADDEAATLIAGDGLDLLVDLAGHAPGNRLGVLARKPAPCQASWLDYFDTTGVAAIDFLIGDRFHTPPVHVDRFSERLVLMPEARFVYRTPLATTAAMRPRPSGPVRFGSFNRHAKIVDAVVDAWSRILAATPGATLTLRASAYRSPRTVELVRERWRARGAPVDRMTFLPYVELAEVHASYDAIDIALDPFPFNGGVTTCDALAHGVPVVALAGERMVSRQGVALLHAARRTQWVAPSVDAYVDHAVSLADVRALERERAALVEALPATPLCDVDAFTRALERAYEAMLHATPGREPIVVPARAPG